MFLKISPSSGVPIGKQIIEQVKYLVVSGRLKPGDKIPTVRELAKNLKVNPTTVVRAYTELQHQAVIYKRQGQGTYIAEASQDLNKKQREKKLLELSERLAVEGIHMGVDPERIVEILKEKLREIQRGNNQDEK